MQEKFCESARIMKKEDREVMAKRILYLIETKEHGRRIAFANKLRTKTGHVNDWLVARAAPGPYYRQLICAEYGVSDEWLRGETDVIEEKQEVLMCQTYIAELAQANEKIITLEKEKIKLEGAFEYAEKINNRFFDRIENVLVRVESASHRNASEVDRKDRDSTGGGTDRTGSYG